MKYIGMLFGKKVQVVKSNISPPHSTSVRVCEKRNWQEVRRALKGDPSLFQFQFYKSPVI